MVTANIAGAIGLVTQGKLRALAVTGKQRSPQLPDVPTVAETLPGFENIGWFGLMAPAATPKEVVDKVYRDTAKILDSTEMRARFYVLGMVPVGNTPAQFADAIRKESARWAKVVRERKIVVN
jgi:tripartite-type tricarboxylate transporter receptor subunit TctC